MKIAADYAWKPTSAVEPGEFIVYGVGSKVRSAIMLRPEASDGCLAMVVFDEADTAFLSSASPTGHVMSYGADWVIRHLPLPDTMGTATPEYRPAGALLIRTDAVLLRVAMNDPEGPPVRIIDLGRASVQAPQPTSDTAEFHSWSIWREGEGPTVGGLPILTVQADPPGSERSARWRRLPTAFEGLRRPGPRLVE